MAWGGGPGWGGVKSLPVEGGKGGCGKIWEWEYQGGGGFGHPYLKRKQMPVR